MLFSAFETSSPRGGVALFRDASCLGERAFDGGSEQGRDLLPALRDLLAELALDVAALEGVAVGRGPGSYTGIRMGVTAAKTLAWALAVPLVAVSSLEVLAAGASIGRPGRFLVLPCLDGRQGFLYGALFEVRPAASAAPGLAEVAGRLVRRTPDLVAREDRILGDIARAVASLGEDPPPLLALGDAAERALAHSGWPAELARDRAPPELDVARAALAGALSATRLVGASVDRAAIHALAPAYLRPTEAERRLAERSS